MTTIGYGVKLPPKLKTRGVLYLRNLPPGLKNLFKSIVVRREETMEDVVVELVRKYCEDPGCVQRWKKKRERKSRKEKK